MAISDWFNASQDVRGTVQFAPGQTAFTADIRRWNSLGVLTTITSDVQCRIEPARRERIALLFGDRFSAEAVFTFTFDADVSIEVEDYITIDGLSYRVLNLLVEGGDTVTRVDAAIAEKQS